MDITGWSVVPDPSDPGPPFDSLKIIPPAGTKIDACSGFCVNIPMCNPKVHYTVWITDDNDKGAPTPCTPHPSMDFKRIANPSSSPTQGESNYPNPVTQENQFKTTIPFLMPSDGGDAKINIFDVSGRLIHTETMSFSGNGKHFFYFTATDVPTGSYTYTIESPLGVTIVQRNLLIVK
ncbi:MAG TPA: T9SS type A sorting domain-containing protein [Candidatus Kapabacteria bacterium]|nr:T9SS type A sorting domain-containing protein [Candidatus Kapabacteria bacterium]